MRLCRRVDGVPVVHPTTAPPRATGPVQRGERGDQCGRRRRILNDTTAPAAGTEPGRQVEQIGEPVEHHGLHLGARRAGGPQHALHAQARADQVGEHGRAGRVGREVPEEPRMLPVREVRYDDPVEVVEQAGEPVAVGGRPGRQRGGRGTRRSSGRHPLLRQSRPVVGDPVDQGVPVPAELLRRHVSCHGPTLPAHTCPAAQHAVPPWQFTSPVSAACSCANRAGPSEPARLSSSSGSVVRS